MKKEISTQIDLNPEVQVLIDKNNNLEKELRKLKLIVDNAYDMQRWLLVDGTLAYVSPSCKRITGYSKDEHYMNPLLFREIIHPDDKKRFDNQLTACYNGDLFEPDIARLIKKNGEVVWIGVAVTLIENENGEILGYCTSTRDMSEQKELELELEKSQNMYSKIVNDQVDLICRLTPDGIVTFVNKATERFFRRSKADIDGQNFRSFFSEEIIKKGERIVGSLSVEKPTAKLVYPYTYSEGNTDYIEMFIQGFFDGEAVLNEIQLIGRDITDYIQAQSKLELSEELYRLVVESQTDLILRYKPDSTITFVNQGFLKFTGLKYDDIIGKKWIGMTDEATVRQTKDQIKTQTIESPTRTNEAVVNRNDGEKRHIAFTNTVLYDESGNHFESQTVGHDITELKEAEKSLSEALNEVNELKQKLEEENRYLRQKYVTVPESHGILTESALMKEVLNKVEQVSGTDSPVLIFGETGTGKELIAQAIHNSSKRRRKLMITVNCAALPPSLIESELFGREKGAYTGALSSQIGRFQLADGSTIFLDEIGELPLEIQVKLLRVLQFGEFQALGSPLTRKVNVRILAATNRNLAEEIEDGIFRSDLFYRLNVFPIDMPPLRDRREDIPMLAWSFVDEISGNAGKQIEKISPDSMKNLIKYHWPGNVRELRNIIEYSLIMCKGPTLNILTPEVKEGDLGTENLDENQRVHIEKVLDQTGWRIRGKDGAAERLGMKESTLRYRMKKLGIEKKEY